MNDLREPAVSQLESGATLSVDLAAIVRNWRTLQAVCGEAECGAVVKADAYGVGLEPVVRELSAAGCKTYFVAHVFEGRRARAIDASAIIYVLNGLVPGTAPAYLEHGLRPVLCSLPEIEEWLQFCALFGRRSAEGETLPAALQLDTGLNRLGLRLDQIERAADLTESLNIKLILSQFIWSGQSNLARCETQVSLFESMRQPWKQVPASIANSAGIFLERTPLYDLVRPGYALYGGNPAPGRPNPMQGVLRLEARILQVNHVEQGETVGYDGRYLAKSPRRLATISIGYADGIPRSALGSEVHPGGEVVVKGVRCPFVGRVSMDLTVVDITLAPEAMRGDTVELIGKAISIDELATRSRTIGYEILTNLGSRFYRRYTHL
ncbi:alanine racemase [Beijerinckia indica]|uniref:Alanine racemase n=1 Tax=Beijerinckia indica subsp. indica (strain ATCC 9039 / DSM 1715 / NCIMB 8712) TaxID=395963 RepID=B2IHD6_BEII9|nr:alanine racemase [Beijerinckia indica]ACB95921.1 alanine racemase [Beijerinckia indica subsp. indica ATCC 9039]